jgi:hypothetical protein
MEVNDELVSGAKLADNAQACWHKGRVGAVQVVQRVNEPPNIGRSG